MQVTLAVTVIAIVATFGGCAGPVQNGPCTTQPLGLLDTVVVTARPDSIRIVRTLVELASASVTTRDTVRAIPIGLHATTTTTDTVQKPHSACYLFTTKDTVQKP